MSLITQEIKEKCIRIIQNFETGGAKPNYGKVTILPDGPERMRQVTYGSLQTTEYGNLNELVKRYAAAGGSYSTQLAKYVGRIGKGKSLETDKEFIRLLKAAGSDPIMVKVQDKFFEDIYYAPAYRWFYTEGFTLPLSLLVIFDSYIHSGGILDKLRSRFPAVPPSKGGKEKNWIAQYVDVRDRFLEFNTSKPISNSEYRTDSFIYAMRNDNWLLDKPFLRVNYPYSDNTGTPQIQATIN